MNNLKKYIKILSVISLIMLVACVIPLCLAGLYVHPVGDDYYYGYKAAVALREGHGIFGALKEAFLGTIHEYQIWQGTYSAMFLMHLPPVLFSDTVYKLYPAFIILFLVISVFYLLKPFFDKDSEVGTHSWISVSSLLCIFMLEEVPNCGETFYWYNGSMYYTGFLALTFIFFGLLFRYFKDHEIYRIIILSVIAFLIGGGNYASVLPAILLTVFACVLSVITDKENRRKNLLAIIPLAITVAGLLISVLAPGNAVRGESVAGLSAPKAIAKSLIACFNYMLYWNGIIFFLILALLTPVFVYIIKSSNFKFRFPYIVIPVAFGIFASSECASFYAQGNGGPARLFDICFYMTALTVTFNYFYLMGNFIKTIEYKKERKLMLLTAILEVFLAVTFLLLLFVRPLNLTYVTPNSVTAVTAFFNGDLKRYDSQYQTRMNMVENGAGQDLVFDAYDVPDNLNYFIHVGDLSDDPNAFNNTTFSEFYGVNSVRVIY